MTVWPLSFGGDGDEMSLKGFEKNLIKFEKRP
jgi:hypothetical protein